MPTTGKLSPASWGKYHTDWSNPEDAVSSDNQRASESKVAQHNDWYDFNMAGIPAGAIIDKIRIYAEGYVDDPETDLVQMGYKRDGTEVTAWSFDCGFTASESLHQILELEPSAPLNTKEDWVDLITSFNYTEIGGCLSPDSEVEMWDGTSVRADKIKIGDEVLSFDFKKKKFVKGIVKNVIVHKGDYLLYKFFTVKPDGSITDICVSPTHPLYVSTRLPENIEPKPIDPTATRYAVHFRSAIEARKVKVGDTLTDLWELEGYGKVLRPVRIVKIERVPSDRVIEIVTEPKTFFAGEKLGKSKT